MMINIAQYCWKPGFKVLTVICTSRHVRIERTKKNGSNMGSLASLKMSSL